MDSLCAIFGLLWQYVVEPVRLANDMRDKWYRLNAKYRVNKLFPEFFVPNSRLTLILPSIRLKPSSKDCWIIAYKDRNFGDIPGQVNTIKPFIRHTDAFAATELMELFRSWFPHLEQKLDDEMTEDDCDGNIICIGGQTNWVFRQYLYEQKRTKPLEYSLERGKKDWFTDPTMKAVWSSDDNQYAYGLICSIKNNENPNCRILFISGLNHPETIATAKRFSADMVNLYELLKRKGLLRSQFYCIVKFRRTTAPAHPLAFESYITGRIS